MTRNVLKSSGISYVEVPNEAAFYGPKIDVQAWSVIGREFSIATNQVDFAQPRRFNLVYKDKDNTEKTPLCIHRAPLGTHERFIGFLIEHYAGNFPLWLSPEQVRILTIGYDEFRPLQEEIVSDALAGRDVFALMPTGGGKSLCFQLPALLRDGLTIVISPLISLMKDQVDALQTSGIAATFLNSALDRHEAVERLRGLNHGQYRMLYLAPERLMLDGFLERALNWNITQIAIDEAHCISEWGHDFRPEYRELKKLRRHMPGVPIMALTATAPSGVAKKLSINCTWTV